MIAMTGEMANSRKWRRKGYDGVVVAVPVTIPYKRYSIESAHWWLASVLSELTARSGILPNDIDGLSVSSFTLSPETTVGLTQHLGLTQVRQS